LKFQCKVCDRKFSQAGRLRRHKAQVHEPKKPRDQVKCDFCDYTMLNMSDVAMTMMTMLHHKAKVHFSTRVAEVLPPHTTTCSECGKVFMSTHNLLNHWVGVHNTFRTWVQEELRGKQEDESDQGSGSDSDDVVIELADSESGEDENMKFVQLKTSSWRKEGDGDEEEVSVKPVMEEEENSDRDECSIWEEEVKDKVGEDGEKCEEKEDIMKITAGRDKVEMEDEDSSDDDDVELVLEEDSASEEISFDYTDNVMDKDKVSGGK